MLRVNNEKRKYVIKRGDKIKIKLTFAYVDSFIYGLYQRILVAQVEVALQNENILKIK